VRGVYVASGGGAESLCLVLALVAGISAAPAWAGECGAGLGDAGADPRAMVAAMQCLEARIERLLPPGSVLLARERCPQGAFEDLTERLSGRYVVIDNTVAGEPSMGEGDGQHRHRDDGRHGHRVRGRAGPLGGGARAGDGSRSVPNRNNRVRLEADAAAEGSEHAHSGGRHEHKRAGFRICVVR